MVYTYILQAEFRPFTVTPHKKKVRNYSDNKYPFLSLSTYNVIIKKNLESEKFE